MGPFIGHDELKMDPEEFPAETVVMLRPDDFPEPDRNDGGIAPGGADIDAVAGDRIERIEIHDILARLAVDPVNRGLDCQLAQMIAEITGGGVKTDDREVAPDGQQHDARAVASEIGIEF